MIIEVDALEEEDEVVEIPQENEADKLKRLSLMGVLPCEDSGDYNIEALVLERSSEELLDGVRFDSNYCPAEVQEEGGTGSFSGMPEQRKEASKRRAALGTGDEEIDVA